MIGFLHTSYIVFITTINTTCLLVSMTYTGVKFSIRTAKALRDVMKEDKKVE